MNKNRQENALLNSRSSVEEGRSTFQRNHIFLHGEIAGKGLTVEQAVTLPRLPLLATHQRSYRRAGPYLTLFSSSGFASPGRRPLFRNACTAARPQPVPACSFCPLRALWPQQRRGRSSRGRQEIMVRFPSRNGLSRKKKNSGRDETSLFRIFRDEIFLER